MNPLRLLARLADTVMGTKAPAMWSSSSLESSRRGVPPVAASARPPAVATDSTPAGDGGRHPSP